MTQTIKPNDLVYIPYLSTCIFTAKHSFHSKLCVVYGDEEFDFLPSGKLDRDDVAPLVYLATPEIKAKLEGFYGITLEDIPVDEEFIAFDIKLAKLQSTLHKIYTQNHDDLDDEAEAIHQELLQMFKERGSK